MSKNTHSFFLHAIVFKNLICVADPFILTKVRAFLPRGSATPILCSKNVSGMISKKVLKRFKEECAKQSLMAGCRAIT